MNKLVGLKKNLDLVFKIIFIILIGLIFYTFYRSEILYDGLYRNYYLKFYIFLISSLLFLFLINFFNSEIKLATYIVLVSVVIGLYICEALLLIDFKNIRGKTVYQFYVDLKKNQDVVVSVNPNLHILNNINQKKIFPVSGISKKLTILCKRVEDNNFVTYKSDRYGFRNADKNWDEKEINFVLLGDSFVHGNCVDSDKIISAQLSKIYKDKFDKKINTINLAFSGNGPLLEYATLREYLKNIKTEKILYFFYEGNDFENLHLELRDPFLRNYLDDAFQQNLLKRQDDVDKSNYDLLNQEIQKKRTNLYEFMKLWKIRMFLSQFLNKKLKIQKIHEKEKIYKSYKDILVNIKKLTENYNADLYFVYLPFIGTFTDSNDDEMHSKVISMVRSLNIKYIDLSNIFKSELDDPLLMFQSKRYQHLNEEGYRFIAKTIANKFK